MVKPYPQNEFYDSGRRTNLKSAREETKPVSVPRIKEVGPSFKADNEHFRVFILDDGRCAFVIGDVSWGRGQPIPN